MRAQGLPLLAVLLAALSLMVAPESRAARARSALVIGNAQYQSIAPLRNPVNDAQDMAAALRSLDFHVSYYENASQAQMEHAIRDFGKRLRSVKGDALFYYAGHGIEREGRNFMIPIGAGIETPEDLRYKAVDVGQVLDYMESADNGVNIIILDACRNNPYRSFRALGIKGLAAMTGPTGSIIAFATAPGEVAADGSGSNGLFTKHLLAEMKRPGVPIEQTFQAVRKRVAQETDGRQIPWSNSSVIGEFYFTPADRIAALSPTSEPAPAAERGIRRSYFDLQQDGTLLDSRTDLRWYCPDDRETYTQKDAVRFAKKTRLPSGGGWRLPTESEFTSFAGGDQSPAGLLAGLRADVYHRYWLAESNFWLGEGKSARIRDNRVEVDDQALTDRNRVCLVRFR